MNTVEKKSLEFAVQSRKAGTAYSRKLRRTGQVPAVVYGKNQKTIPLSLDIRLAEKYTKKTYENKIFTFKSEEKLLNGLKVLKKDVSYHKLTRKPVHIDFFSLDMNKPVRVNVEVHFTGKAKGVKESGGVFNIVRRDVEVECLPAEIPDSLSIDISSLDINQNFHVSDLSIPENIKLITSKKASLCAVSEIAEEETKPAETAATEAEDTKEAASTAAADSDKKTPDKKTPDKKTPDKKTPDKKTPDKKTSDKK